MPADGSNGSSSARRAGQRGGSWRLARGGVPARGVGAREPAPGGVPDTGPSLQKSPATVGLAHFEGVQCAQCIRPQGQASARFGEVWCALEDLGPPTVPDLPSLLPAGGQAPGTVRILRLSRPALMPRRGDIVQTYRGPAGTGRMGDADGSAGPAGTRSRDGVYGGFCSPAAVSRYPGAMVAGLACTPPAHVSERSHPRHHRRDANVQPGPARLILGVCRDEPLGGLGPGVPAAGR